MTRNGEEVAMKMKDVRVWKLDQARSSGLLALLKKGSEGRTNRKVIYKGWMIEDEDMLNVNLWRDGVDKAWCKFDIEPGLFIERARLDKNMYSDPIWYPDGMPILFISSHNTKGFEATDWLLNLLEHCTEKRVSLKCPSNPHDLSVCKLGSMAE